MLHAIKITVRIEVKIRAFKTKAERINHQKSLLKDC